MVDNAFYDSHSKRTNEWYTPLSVYEPLNREFNFTTDAAAEPTNRLGCKVFFTKQQNGLESSKWVGNVWINPPYSDPVYPVYKWVKTANDYSRRTGNVVVMLLRSTSEVAWFQDFVWDQRTDNWRQGVKVKYPDKRINFVPVKENQYGYSELDSSRGNNNTFASVIVIFNHGNNNNYCNKQQEKPPTPPPTGIRADDGPTTKTTMTTSEQVQQSSLTDWL
jgi:phage N-6-adenine-methyltransferase